MDWNFLFFGNSVLLGIGLAMDAFSVSLANGLHEPFMKKRRMVFIAATFAFFQFMMPMIGWVCVHTILQYFQVFGHFIPWIALLLLGYIGGKMIYGYFYEEREIEEHKTGTGELFVQGIATSIDALSVGFTIADYSLPMAFVAALLIAIVTFALCFSGILLGKKFGTKFSGKAELLGGIILVVIGVEIFVSNLLSLYF